MLDRTKSDADAPPQKVFLSSRKVGKRYDVTRMTIDRWMADAAMRFPQPALRMKRIRLWDLADLERWELERITRA